MAAKKRVKKQTMREFRAWLEGVEELQPENWSPNRDQWQLIRAKIDGIKEEVVEAAPAAAPATAIQYPFYNNQGTNPPQTLAAGIAPAPQVGGGVPAGHVTVAPTQNPMFNANDGKTKTPDIDTSDGNVSSSFI